MPRTKRKFVVAEDVGFGRGKVLSIHSSPDVAVVRSASDVLTRKEILFVAPATGPVKVGDVDYFSRDGVRINWSTLTKISKATGKPIRLIKRR